MADNPPVSTKRTNWSQPEPLSRSSSGSSIGCGHCGRQLAHPLIRRPTRPIGRAVLVECGDSPFRSAEKASPSPHSRSPDRWRDRLRSRRAVHALHRRATGDFAAISAASSKAIVRAVPAGTSRSAKPSRNASDASICRPVKIRSAAAFTPIRRGSSCVPPPPGISPSPTSGGRNGPPGRHDQVTRQPARNRHPAHSRRLRRSSGSAGRGPHRRRPA